MGPEIVSNTLPSLKCVSCSTDFHEFAHKDVIHGDAFRIAGPLSTGSCFILNICRHTNESRMQLNTYHDKFILWNVYHEGD